MIDTRCSLCLPIQLRLSAEVAASVRARVYLLAISVCSCGGVTRNQQIDLAARLFRPRALATDSAHVHKARKSRAPKGAAKSAPRAARRKVISICICEHAAGCKKQNEAKPAATGSCPRVSSLLERRATLYFWLECRHGYKRNTGEMNAEGCFWSQSLHRRVLTKELSGGPFTRFSHSPPQVITHESNSSL